MSKVNRFFKDWDAEMNKRHPLQVKINKYILDGTIKPTMNLRDIGELLGVDHLQRVKYHMEQVKKKPVSDYGVAADD